MRRTILAIVVALVVAGLLWFAGNRMLDWLRSLHGHEHLGTGEWSRHLLFNPPDVRGTRLPWTVPRPITLHPQPGPSFKSEAAR